MSKEVLDAIVAAFVADPTILAAIGGDASKAHFRTWLESSPPIAIGDYDGQVPAYFVFQRAESQGNIQDGSRRLHIAPNQTLLIGLLGDTVPRVDAIEERMVDMVDSLSYVKTPNFHVEGVRFDNSFGVDVLNKRTRRNWPGRQIMFDVTGIRRKTPLEVWHIDTTV